MSQQDQLFPHYAAAAGAIESAMTHISGFEREAVDDYVGAAFVRTVSLGVEGPPLDRSAAAIASSTTAALHSVIALEGIG